MDRKPDRCLTFTEYPYPGTPNYIYIWSRTRRGADERTTFVSGDIVVLLKGLKEKEGEAIWLVGGSPWWEKPSRTICSTMIVSVHPILPGKRCAAVVRLKYLVPLLEDKRFFCRKGEKEYDTRVKICPQFVSMFLWFSPSVG